MTQERAILRAIADGQAAGKRIKEIRMDGRTWDKYRFDLPDIVFAHGVIDESINGSVYIIWED